METPEAQKKCENCRWYSQHFSKRDTMYDRVCCGHCICMENKSRKNSLLFVNFGKLPK